MAEGSSVMNHVTGVVVLLHYTENSIGLACQRTCLAGRHSVKK
jgi:hypothetical protein